MWAQQAAGVRQAPCAHMESESSMENSSSCMWELRDSTSQARGGGSLWERESKKWAGFWSEGERVKRREFSLILQLLTKLGEIILLHVN